MSETRHFGRDAEIQRPGKANFGVLHCQNEALVPASSYRSWPRYRHPCRYEGIFGPAGLVYNDEIWSLEASIKASFGAQNKHDLNQLHSLVLCHFVGFRGISWFENA